MAFFVLATVATWLSVPRDETRVRGFAFSHLALNERLLTVTSVRAQYADAVREPASIALFADERSGSGITRSFRIRGIVWRSGALLAPVLGGYLMDAVAMWVVFVVAGAVPLVGAPTMVGIVTLRDGPGKVTRW